MVATSHRARFISNSLFNVAFRLLNQLIAIFILPLFVKNIGAELYGIWVLASVVLGYLGLLELGFSTGITRYVSKFHETREFKTLNNVINTGVFFYLCIGSVICCICLILNAQILGLFAIRAHDLTTARNLLAIAGIFAVVAWPMKIARSVFEGMLKFRALSILSGIQSMGSTIVMLVCVYQGLNIETIAIAYNASTFVFWIPLAVAMKRQLPEFTFGVSHVKLTILKEMLPFSLGVFISQAIYVLSIQLDNLIIGVCLSMGAVTAYVVAAKLFRLTASYLSMLSGVIWPTVFTADAAGDKKVIEEMLTRGSKYMTIIVSPVAYLGILVSTPFIRLWMGPEYVQYAIWSQVFMVVFLIGPGLGLAPNIAMALGKCRAVNTVSAIQVVLNLAVSISLVRVFGIGGPIIGTVASSVLLGGPLVFPYFCKIIGVGWRGPQFNVYKITGANVPVFLVLYWTAHWLRITNWPVLILFSAVALGAQYAVLYLLFFRQEEKGDLGVLLSMFGIRS